tara:strand:- start:481 stop:636 length:156 start_codon:yes stop_codon:yes gene_type:complete
LSKNIFIEYYQKKSAILYEQARAANEKGKDYQRFLNDAVDLDNRIKELSKN